MFCCLLGCENRWSLPNTPPGYWALCTLLSYDSAPFLSCGKFPSGVRPGPVIACHLSGPCPRGPCGAGGLLDLPLVPLAWPRAACAASAGRAGGSWFFNSQPLTTAHWKLPLRFLLRFVTFSQKRTTASDRLPDVFERLRQFWWRWCARSPYRLRRRNDLVIAAVVQLSKSDPRPLQPRAHRDRIGQSRMKAHPGWV